MDRHSLAEVWPLSREDRNLIGMSRAAERDDREPLAKLELPGSTKATSTAPDNVPSCR
jgi:hypothetical protein